MSAELNPSTESLLARVVEHAPQQALDALSGKRTLDAVGWASAHLAAVERAIHPVAVRRLSDGDTVVTASRHLSAHIEDGLRTLERLHTGDALVARIDGVRLRRRLAALVDDHIRVLDELVALLDDALSPADQHALAASYRRALEHAPTRPHPHAPHTGALGRIAFRVDALRDRVMDVMDSRHVPAPRAPREPVQPGPWGLWLLGQPRGDRTAG